LIAAQTDVPFTNGTTSDVFIRNSNQLQPLSQHEFRLNHLILHAGLAAAHLYGSDGIFRDSAGPGFPVTQYHVKQLLLLGLCGN
jgi:hypothetical protein